MSEDTKKYTISFISGQPGLVVKADDSVELENALAKILPIYKKFREAISVIKEATRSEPNAPKTGISATCEVHNIKMAEGFSKKTGKPYWYHRDDDKICFGKGYVE